MWFKAKDNQTGHLVELSEDQVKREIIDTLQHDIRTCAEYSDSEIEEGVNMSSVLDYFENTASFEGWNYEIYNPE
jgi:hypothetical protein